MCGKLVSIAMFVLFQKPILSAIIKICLNEKCLSFFSVRLNIDTVFLSTSINLRSAVYVCKNN